MQTSNPAFRSDIYRSARSHADINSERMTVDGTVQKTGFLLLSLF